MLLLTENRTVYEGKSSKKDPNLSLTRGFLFCFLFTVFNTASSATLSLSGSVSLEAGGGRVVIDQPPFKIKSTKTTCPVPLF
jgi:hypothetical protein